MKIFNVTSALALFVSLFFTTAMPVSESRAASAVEINAEVTATLNKFYRNVGSARELASRASGILVFPTVIKAGFGIGGEYGEGALRAGGRTVAYYNTVSASVGFQIGAQARSVIIMFMTPAALGKFQRSNGWEIGVDGSVALVTLGAGGTIDTNNIQAPIIGFIYGSKGLMYNLTLEGSKITRIRK